MLNIFTDLADLVVYRLLGGYEGNHWYEALHFFVEDVSKIFVLVTLMIFLIGFLRAGLDTARVRNFLSGKKRFAGYFLASGFGAVTPFCSCSSIPLFLGFTSARIPLGITMAFLITSPMINEVAVVLMGGLLGWKFLLLYVGIGVLAGVLGGFFLDLIGAEKYLMPIGRKVSEGAREPLSENVEPGAAVTAGEAPTGSADVEKNTLSFRDRWDFAASELGAVMKRIWIWIIVGVALGGLIHGFVPESFLLKYLGKGSWWSVPAAVLVGIPLYGGVSATVPVVSSLIVKGLPAGTAVAFMMSVVAASVPEFVMLKQVMKTRLLVIFFFMLFVFFTLAGWILNLVL